MALSYPPPPGLQLGQKAFLQHEPGALGLLVRRDQNHFGIGAKIRAQLLGRPVLLGVEPVPQVERIRHPALQRDLTVVDSANQPNLLRIVSSFTNGFHVHGHVQAVAIRKRGVAQFRPDSRHVDLHREVERSERICG
jgi:hypothetical protein